MESDHASNLAQSSANIIVSKQGSLSTAIAFAGIRQKFGGIPPFNFVGIMEGTNSNVIFARDPNNKWFGNPIPDLGDGPQEIAAKLRDTVDALGTEHLCLLGISSGAFAALMFSALIGYPCRVLAFSPQTSIAPRFLNEAGDGRYSRELKDRIDTEFEDVLPLLSEATNVQRIHAVLGRQDPLDARHVRRLAALPNAQIHSIDSGHNTAGHLKKQRLLRTVIHSFIHGQEQQLAEALADGDSPGQESCQA